MSSFVRFVLKYKKSDCAYGDVARDMLQDELINRAWGYRTFRIYLQNHHNVSDNILALIDELYDLYKLHQAGLYKLKKTTTTT